MHYRNATRDDLPQIENLLKQNDLPYEDCSEHIRNFIVLANQQTVIGVAGLEIYQNIGLLRSIAVQNDFRNQGLGERLISKIKTRAYSCNINQLFLLTETADHYFKKQGFEVIDRYLAPDSIKQTRQFTHLCPDSAIVMASKL